jgi:cbb3-type cytochrome oxidase subunit 1
MLFNKGTPIHPALWRLLPAHVEFVLIGWMGQLILGVAFWILPRFSRGPARGSESLAWLAFGLINLGVWLAGVGPLLGASPLLAVLGRLAEAGAAAAFVAHAWPRVKPLGA